MKPAFLIATVVAAIAAITLAIILSVGSSPYQLGWWWNALLLLYIVAAVLSLGLGSVGFAVARFGGFQELVKLDESPVFWRTCFFAAIFLFAAQRNSDFLLLVALVFPPSLSLFCLRYGRGEVHLDGQEKR